MELYEGKDRWSPAGEPFSSSASWRTPVVERQAYILPALPSAAAFTITERSLTDRHVLCMKLPNHSQNKHRTTRINGSASRVVPVGLSSGGVVEVPWSLVEARRGAAGEESVLPYLPELPLTADRVLSYNLTLHRLAALHTAPAGLESTSLMLATGLGQSPTTLFLTYDLCPNDTGHSSALLLLLLYQDIIHHQEFTFYSS